MSEVIVLAPNQEAEWREYWERQGYRVVIARRIDKGGTADNIKDRLNERLRRN